MKPDSWSKYLIMFIMFPSICLSQVTLEWQATYSQDTIIQVFDMALDKDDNVHVIAMSKGVNNGWDITTLKYNTNGMLLWSRKYDSPDSSLDRPWSIALDDSSNVFIAAESSTFGMLTIKYDKSANQKWVRTYIDGGYYTAAYDIVVDDDGNGQ